MEQCYSSIPSTSPPPRTAIDCGSILDSLDEPSPCKKPRISIFEQKLDESLSTTVRLVLKNGEITMERSLLAQFSNYFRCLFSSAFRDSKENVHRIRLVTIADLHFLLTIPRAFENGIKPELTLQRAIQLLEPAAYLQIDMALDHIADVISRNLHHENVIRLFRFSLLYHTPLALRIWRFIIIEFQILFNTKEYLKLTETELMTLLTEKRLNIKSADEKVACTTWLQHHQFENPERMTRFVELNVARRSQPDSTFYEVIRSRQPRSGLITHGGWASRRPGRIVEIFNTRADVWQESRMEMNDEQLLRSYHAIEIVDDTMLLYGGFCNGVGHQTTIRFDMRTKKWRYGRNMHDRRCYISGAKMKDSSGTVWCYACGGMSANRHTSAEVYNFQEDRWTRIADMNLKRSDGWTISIGGKIACVGGFDGRNGHMTGELYDPAADRWTMLSRPMRTRRTGTAAVNIMDQAIAVCGGFTGSRRTDTCEMYDLREGVWHHLPNMQSGRSNFGINFVENTSIYVAGGFNGSATTKETERLDLRMRKWKALPDMREAKSALRLLDIADHPILDEIFQIADEEEIVMTW